MTHVCSYLVIPAPGEVASLTRRLAALRGCEVFPARNRDLLILVCETDDAEAERVLRASIEAMPGVRMLLVTFGEIDGDPVAAATDHSATGAP